MSFGGWIITVIIAWLIQRVTLKGNPNRQLSETLFIVLWIPIANVILSAVFWFAKEKNIDANWIIKNIYQIKD